MRRDPPVTRLSEKEQSFMFGTWKKTETSQIETHYQYKIETHYQYKEWINFQNSDLPERVELLYEIS